MCPIAPFAGEQHPDDQGQAHRDLNDECKIRGQWRGGPEKPSVHKPALSELVFESPSTGVSSESLTGRRQEHARQSSSQAAVLPLLQFRERIYPGAVSTPLRMPPKWPVSATTKTAVNAAAK